MTTPKPRRSLFTWAKKNVAAADKLAAVDWAAIEAQTHLERLQTQSKTIRDATTVKQLRTAERLLHDLAQTVNSLERSYCRLLDVPIPEPVALRVAGSTCGNESPTSGSCWGTLQMSTDYQTIRCPTCRREGPGPAAVLHQPTPESDQQ